MVPKTARRAGRRGRASAFVGALAGAVLGLSACGDLMTPNKVTLSQADLQARLERQFPLDRKLLDVLDVHVAVPVLTLLPARDRVETAFDVDVKDRLFGGQYHAHMTMDYGLRIEPADQSLRLTDVTVQQLSAESGSNSLHVQAQRIAGLLAEQVLKDKVVFRLKPEQAERLARAGKQAKSVRVTPQGLEILLGPLDPAGAPQ